ncbi:hypothetical protein, partial [Parendozoicomonas sp. Alg238-R29]|uniref:hypothetical protein n=1 Tax=Parendozoicomonas sp. Alg238-R29 TaxID=2993446 RepID=UPI00248E38B2
ANLRKSHNYLTHNQMREMVAELKQCQSETCTFEIIGKYATIDAVQQDTLNELCNLNAKQCQPFVAEIIAEEEANLALLDEFKRNGGNLNTRIFLENDVVAGSNISLAESFADAYVAQHGGDKAALMFAMASGALVGGKKAYDRFRVTKGTSQKAPANANSTSAKTDDEAAEVVQRPIKSTSSKPPRKSQDYELTTNDLRKLKASKYAHTLERHGPDISAEKLKRRVIEGIAPDESFIPKMRKGENIGNIIPPMSSKFESNSTLKLALDSVNQDTQAFANALAKAQDELLAGKKLTKFKFQVDLGQSVGHGYKKPVGTSNFVSQGHRLDGEPIRVNNLTKVEARYVLNPSTGQFELNTLFPTN